MLHVNRLMKGNSVAHIPSGKSRVTIKDVARAAGVSLGSVSNVINSSPKPSDALKARVLAAADELGFEINRAAQTLRSKRSKVIGLVTTSTVTDYLRGLADALDVIATRNGFELLQSFSRQDTRLEYKRVRSLLQRQTDGIIFLPGLEPDQAFDALYAARRPTVVIDRLFDDHRFDYVVPDHERAMRDLVQLFVAKGHQRLAFIPQNIQVATTRQRLRGLDLVVRAEAPRLTAHIIEWPSDPAALEDMLSTMVYGDAGVTGVIAGNSHVAISIIEACTRAGITVPETISLATFDDPPWAQILTPPLTSIYNPADAIADEVWRLMSRQLTAQERGETSVAHERVKITAEIKQRGSLSSPMPPIAKH